MSEPEVVPHNYVATEEDLRTAETVYVEESTEKWSEFLMQDGMRIRVKTTILNVYKLANKIDDKGNPIYAMNISPLISVMHAKK